MSDTAPRPGPDEAWDDLLHELRTQPKAQPRPFFYGRVQARLAANTAAAAGPALPTWLRRPAYAVLLSVLMLTLSGDAAALRAAAGAAPRRVSPAR